VHRAACLLIASLAGCDRVWGLERPDAGPSVDNGDEDGDGIPNGVDPCPHIAFQSTTDSDKDGLPADCDPDDTMVDTQHRFFSFDTLEPGLDIAGGDPVADGEMVFGATTDGLSTLVIRDLATDTAVLDVGFEILASNIDEGQISMFDELGIYTIHRAFASDNKQRGDVCFFGTNMHDALHPKPIYLEMAEDNSYQGSVSDISTLSGTKGRFRMVRSPVRVDCTVFREGMPSLPNQFDVTDLQDVVGTIAISTQRTRVQLRYVWVAYQPTTRP